MILSLSAHVDTYQSQGYEGKVLDHSPTLSNQPGMTNANMQVLDVSPTIVADPGLTNANMQVGSSPDILGESTFDLVDRWSP